MKTTHTLLAALCGLLTLVSARAADNKPSILVIFGDDLGQASISAYAKGVMGYRTPNIDRLAKGGMMFADDYAEQSCTAGRSSFITGLCASLHRAFESRHSWSCSGIAGYIRACWPKAEILEGKWTPPAVVKN